MKKVTTVIKDGEAKPVTVKAAKKDAKPKTTKGKGLQFDGKKLAADLWAYREKNNLTVKTAAKNCGIGATTYNQIEAGAAPRMWVFAKLCNLLGVQPNAYFI